LRARDLALWLMSAFAAVGLLLVGIGSTAWSYATARRTHEIGIRMALEATRADSLN